MFVTSFAKYNYNNASLMRNLQRG